VVIRRQKSILGLDLGSQAIKAVEVTLDGVQPVISGLARVEVPPGGSRQQAIAEALSSGRFRSKNVVTSVAGQSVVVRYISMVQMSDSELRQAIRFESDKYLPFDADEIVLDCQRLMRTPGTAESDQMNVVLAACRTSVVEQQIQEVVEQGLSPCAVDVEVFALANAWELAGDLSNTTEEGEERVIALVDIGASRTQINVLAGGETCFSREIGIGGADMTQATARRLGVELHEAEAVKRRPDEQESDVARAIGPVLEDLVSELALSLDYVENRETLRVEEVLLSGGSSNAPGLLTFLEQGTGRPVRTWNPVGGLRVDEGRVDLDLLDEAASSLAVAVGLAARLVSQ
jgi:type IV pilus assembly protein PilM